MKQFFTLKLWRDLEFLFYRFTDDCADRLTSEICFLLTRSAYNTVV